jgi:hypothetical protein
MGGVGISHTTVSFLYRWNLLLWFHKLYRMYMFYTYVAFMFFNTHNILYNYIFIWIQSKCSLMLVVSLFEVLNLVIIKCLFYYSIIYLYYQLFIHQNYTRSAHILKRGIFLIWGPYRIQPFGKPNVRFGIGRSDMRHRFYIFCQRPNPAILLFVFYFWIIYL